jgi:sn-glycerol 3-phosphate transport system permease protein
VFFTNYTTIVDLGLYNSYGALAVPFLATGFGAFLLRQAFLTTPRDLRDAAQLDGYGHWRFMARVAVPLARPAIAALAVFSFLTAWGQYLWPLIVTEDSRFRTVQVGLKQLTRGSADQINVTFAGVVLASVPLFILLLVFQKQLVRGLAAGAVKG